MNEEDRNRQLQRARESTAWHTRKHGIDYDGSVRPTVGQPAPDKLAVTMQDGSQLPTEDRHDLNEMLTDVVSQPPEKRRRFAGTTIVNAKLTITVSCAKEEIPGTDGERDVSKKDLKLLDAVIGFCERNKIECHCLVEVADGVF